MSAGIEKIKNDYPEAVNYQIPSDFDKARIQKYMDSIAPQQQFIEQRIKQLKSMHDASSYNALFSDVNYINYLLNKNAEYIQFKNYSTNEIIEKIDSLIQLKSQHAILLFNDSLPLELSDKELINAVKIIDNQCKLAKSELNGLEKEGKLSNPYKYELYLQAILLENQYTVLQACLQNKNFNAQVVNALKSYDGKNKSINKLMEKQAELKEEKFNYILEQTETEHKRGISLVEKIDSDSKSWKKKYSSK